MRPEDLQPGDIARIFELPPQAAKFIDSWVKLVELEAYTGFIEALSEDPEHGIVAHFICIDEDGNAVATGLVPRSCLEPVDLAAEPQWVKAKVQYDMGLLWLAHQTRATGLKASEEKVKIAEAHGITPETLDLIIDDLAKLQML